MIKTEQLHLQKAFEQENADHSNAMPSLWGFTGTIQLKNAFHPAVNCSIMPTQSGSDTSKMQLTIEEAQGAQSLKQILSLLFSDGFSDGTEELIETHDCYRQT